MIDRERARKIRTCKNPRNRIHYRVQVDLANQSVDILSIFEDTQTGEILSFTMTEMPWPYFEEKFSKIQAEFRYSIVHPERRTLEKDGYEHYYDSRHLHEAGDPAWLATTEGVRKLYESWDPATEDIREWDVLAMYRRAAGLV